MGLLVLSWFVIAAAADGVHRAQLSRDERGDASWSERRVFGEPRPCLRML